MSYNVFIRGIYSTALTKLFLDNGYNIIFPSNTIMERFPGLKEYEPGVYSKDIMINDRFDKEGVSITVKKEVWEKIKDKFPLSKENFPDMIRLDARFPLNSIYKGIVVTSNIHKRYSIVRLIPENENEEDPKKNFTTTLGRVNKYIKFGTEDIFQVTFEDVGANYAFLNKGYTVSGDLAVLIPHSRRVFISRKIRDKELREKFRNFIEKAGLDEYGILIRTAAQYATELEIMEEINRLWNKHLEIESKINQTDNRIGEIHSDFVSFTLLFPDGCKRQLDKIRSEVIPTVEGHHKIKSCLIPKNRRNIQILNMIEYTMHKGNLVGLHEDINRMFGSIYLGGLFGPKNTVHIIHNKLNGRSYQLRSGIVKKIEKVYNETPGLKIIIRRNLVARGVYDGLNIPIEEGDYAIGVYELGKMYYETLYYSRENELKGKYFNINTPLVFHPDTISYFDLEIDVIEPLNQPRKIIDRELLDTAFELGIISEELYKRALEIAEKIVSGEIKSELEIRAMKKYNKPLHEEEMEEENTDEEEDKNEESEEITAETDKIPTDGDGNEQ